MTEHRDFVPVSIKLPPLSKSWGIENCSQKIISLKRIQVEAVDRL